MSILNFNEQFEKKKESIIAEIVSEFGEEHKGKIKKI